MLSCFLFFVKRKRMAKELDVEKTKSFVGAAWDETIVPTLCEYIKIPNMSPSKLKGERSKGEERANETTNTYKCSIRNGRLMAT